MDKLLLTERLKKKANVSYDEAKMALEKNDWDILDAIIYLENCERTIRPEVSIFYTNEYKEEYKSEGAIINLNKDNKENNRESKNDFHGIFEVLCRVIDTLNNIFLKVNSRGESLLKLPLTVVVLLFFFMFMIIIPLVIVAIFFDIEFILESSRINVDSINRVLKQIQSNILYIKKKIKEGINND